MKTWRATVRLSAWWALLYGPVFLVRLHVRGFRLGRRRRWILAELAVNALWVFFVFALSGGFAPCYNVAVIAVGRCMTSFFAVWTLHHDCDRSHQIARTLLGKVKKQDLLRDVLPPGASPLPESADLSTAQARRPARQRRSRTASPSGLLNPSG